LLLVSRAGLLISRSGLLISCDRAISGLFIKVASDPDKLSVAIFSGNIIGREFTP